MDEKLNIDITLTTPASQDDFKNQLNTRIAAGDYPDIMELDNRNTLQSLAEKGALLDLTPYVDQLSGIKTMVGDDGFKKRRRRRQNIRDRQNPAACHVSVLYPEGLARQA
ncbi:extracellular solute-binding protein [Cohnella rhizosphaerae]|uniref:extracellular solute-binding protein n=1 Tax=Cohnella rhizosphaerae TaxID=1457232 RepID=UPI003B8A9B03